MFQGYLEVEQALLQQIVTSLEQKIFKSTLEPCHEQDNPINISVFIYLFETNGDVTLQELCNLTA